MNTSMLTKRDTRGDSILAGKSEMSGYMAVRQDADGMQFADHGTFASTPGFCNDMAYPHIVPTDMENWLRQHMPIVGYVRVTMQITERIAA